MSSLTQREHDVLALLIGGDCHKVVAHKLHIERVSVSTFARRARLKLGAKTTNQACAMYDRILRMYLE